MLIKNSQIGRSWFNQRIKFSFLLVSLILGSPQFAWSKATIQVLAERPAISLKQVLSVSVEVSVNNGSLNGELLEPNWSAQGWSRLGRSQSTQMQFINGRQSMQLVYQYQLRPTRVGQLKIGPFKGTGGLSNLVSNVEVVQVSEKTPKLTRTQIEEQNKYAFLRWEVDEKEVWLGQAIQAKLVLYTNRQLRLTRFPLPEITLKDFWIQDLEEPQKRSPKVRIKGYVYQKREVRSNLLSPLKVGEVSLPEVSVDMGLSEFGFYSKEMSLLQTAPSVKIKVKALPSPAPKGFSGSNVGHVKLKAYADRTRVRLDEGIQFHVQVQTTGLLANTPALELPFIEGFKIFPPTQRETEDVNRKRNTRTQTWLLQPVQAGRWTIPSLTLPYFDPVLGKYQVAKTKAISIQIIGQGTAASAPPQNRSSSSSSQNRSTQVDPTQLNSTQKSSNPPSKAPVGQNLSKPKKPTSSELLGVPLKLVRQHDLPLSLESDLQWLWILLGLFGPLLLIGTELKEGWDWVLNQGADSRKQAHAGSWAIEQIENSKAQENSDALDRIIKHYLERKWQCTLESSLRQDWVRFLANKGIEQDLQDSLNELLESYDFTRFASSKEGNALNEICDLAIEWIKAIEKVSSSRGDKS